MIFTETILKHQEEFQKMVDAGALVVVNHSGGKDSQAMYQVIKSLVPADQIEVVHADLGEFVEWGGVQDHIRNNIDTELHIAKAIYKDGSKKELLDMIEKRQMFPSAAQRYCTSDLKRGPCEKVIRRLANERDTKLIISCMGFRAEESPARAKVDTWKLDPRNQTAGRTWVTFQPIHDLTTEEVFKIIENAGQKRHWAYDQGMKRLSCCFCVLAGEQDLKIAAKLNPTLLDKYLDLEKKIGHTFRHGKSLADIVGVQVKPVQQDLFQEATI
ncbi:MAG: phosphoadenosine phosphosulfate reductase [Euryarchaeota archaeon]|nr:phosphoadenosine phosphosulfate reductase [Euryarchaeota archaeon]|tara:strand:- start:305 stop:1117 length:813 start_codon:yes stop_codon:yes gene_type:complete